MLIHDHNDGDGSGRALGVIALVIVLLAVGLMGMADLSWPAGEAVQRVAQAPAVAGRG